MTITRYPVTAVQKAYGLLWREMRVSDKPYVREARAILLAAMTPAEQYDAIAWVQAKYPITENEIAHQ
jgi:hypothetical protein